MTTAGFSRHSGKERSREKCSKCRARFRSTIFYFFVTLFFWLRHSQHLFPFSVVKNGVDVPVAPPPADVMLKNVLISTVGHPKSQNLSRFIFFSIWGKLFLPLSPRSLVPFLSCRGKKAVETWSLRLSMAYSFASLRRPSLFLYSARGGDRIMELF